MLRVEEFCKILYVHRLHPKFIGTVSGGEVIKRALVLLFISLITLLGVLCVTLIDLFSCILFEETP